ncbi:ABC transporter permease [Nocardioides aromaticivorans]|uniref:ABC transporter permease n=1 Tax=Nocardioides aromaticivorans TaxID=200618 RepID=A0ABX7PEH6_9ACTN|nr:amino acid ABC transporter permease [Nocardioides aromaticivorans]QSR24211.1 ABC transporter permease [Nocardioides aromaticivorans]
MDRPPPSAVELERRAWRRRKQVVSVLVGLASTLVLTTAVVVTLRLSPGWQDVKASFFDVSIGWDALPTILDGMWLNVRVLAVATVAVAIVGSALALARTLRGAVFAPVRFAAAAYTDIFRGMPLLIVLYLVGFGVPGLNLFGRVPAEVWGTVAITLTYSSYVAEVLRAGIEAVHPSQRLAARSLGLSHGRTMRLVVLPQAVRKVTPALMNDFVSMQKDVGLISILGAVDAIRSAQRTVTETYNFTPYVVAGLLFVLLSWPMIRLSDWLTARARAREQIGGVV